jgi:hypothetical protein
LKRPIGSEQENENCKTVHSYRSSARESVPGGAGTKGSIETEGPCAKEGVTRAGNRLDIQKSGIGLAGMMENPSRKKG